MFLIEIFKVELVQAIFHPCQLQLRKSYLLLCLLRSPPLLPLLFLLYHLSILFLLYHLSILQHLLVRLFQKLMMSTIHFKKKFMSSGKLTVLLVNVKPNLEERRLVSGSMVVVNGTTKSNGQTVIPLPFNPKLFLSFTYLRLLTNSTSSWKNLLLSIHHQKYLMKNLRLQFLKKFLSYLRLLLLAFVISFAFLCFVY